MVARVGWSPGPAAWKDDLSPLTAAEWNYDRAAHLLAHAGFGGTPAEIQKLAGYAQRGEAIPWVRIYKTRDHVHFPHMRHVNAGVACQTCHGQVQEMGVLSERAPEWGGLDMGWCVSCHVQMGAPRDCTVCHY